MTEVTIKQTEIAQRGLVVEIEHSGNVHHLRPFTVRVRHEPGGSTSVVGHYTCIHTATHAHDATVRNFQITSKRNGEQK
jgi:hypothetical protein